MAAQITGSHDAGANVINYYGVTTGSYFNVYPNLTCLIGNTVNGSDVGSLRVRMITGSSSNQYVTFAENEIIWKHGMHLTFIDLINVEAIYPRIIQDPNQQTNVIFYKDYDIPYSDQNTKYGTFPNAGSHRAGFITTGSCGFYFTATGTYNVAGQSLTYSWAFEGGTPTGSTALTPGLVQWTQPGQYKLRLITTAANGARDTTYRYISVYNRPEQGTNTPVSAWELGDLTGSRAEGGYTASIKIKGAGGAGAAIPELQPNTIVVIFGETQYGDGSSGLGGNAPNNASIRFVGYVLSDTFSFNYKTSELEFKVGSISEIMKETEGFSVSCESKASATTWFELQEMTTAKAMYHYLRWHSTVLNVCDFQYTGDDRLVQYFDSDRESLWDAVDNFVRNGLLGEVVCDRQGKIWAEIASFGLTRPFSSLPNGMTIHKQDWVGEPQITERKVSETSFVELGGIAYNGVETNTFSALLSNAPGVAPLYHGKSERIQGLILLSQLQLNQVAGNYLAYKNARFPEVSLVMGGDYNNIDIAPQEDLFLVISEQDTVRGVSLQGWHFRPESMTWRYNPLKSTFTPELTLGQVATGTIAETVNIPPYPADDGFGIDPIDFPPIPIFDINVPIPEEQTTTMILVDASKGILYTDDFDAVNPTWQFANGGLTQNQYQSINFIFVCPNGAVYCGSASADTDAEVGTDIPDSPFIARANKIGDPFVIIEDSTSIDAKIPGTTNLGLNGAGFNPNVPEQVLYVITRVSDRSEFWIGSASSFTEGANTSSIGQADGKLITFGKNESGVDTWTYIGAGSAGGSPAICVELNSAGTTILSTTTFGDVSESMHIRAGQTPTLFSLGHFSGDIRKSTDNGKTWAFIGNTLLHSGAGLAIDDYGRYGMCEFDVAAKGRTSDYLATFGALATLPPGGEYRFGYIGGAGTASKWIAARGVVRYSPDWGNSWINREGNLLQLLPIPLIEIVLPVRAGGSYSGNNL